MDDKAKQQQLFAKLDALALQKQTSQSSTEGIPISPPTKPSSPQSSSSSEQYQTQEPPSQQSPHLPFAETSLHTPVRQVTPPAPTMANQSVRFNNVEYDLTKPAEATAYMVALSQFIGQQQQTIQTLQQPAINPAQFQQLLTAITPAPQRTQGVRNPVLSTPGNEVHYEEHQVPAGIEDVKGFPDTDPFNGQQTDAEPFMDRLKAYFAAKPKAMRFTRNRILYACTLLKDGGTKAWAALVRRAIANGTNNEYYYDNWDNFQTEFLKRYGLTNRPQYFFRKMTTYRQNQGQDCKAYTDKFERLRNEANATKEAAYFYLKQGTFPFFRSKLILCDNAPDTYDAWIAALVKMQSQLDQEKEYRQGGTQGYWQARNFGPRQHQGQQQAYVPKGHGDPMQVDAIQQGKKRQQQPQQQSRKGPNTAHTKPPPKRTNQRLTPHPTAASSSSNSRPPHNQSSGQTKKKPFYCFICDQPGHFTRDCKASINKLNIEHIQQLGLAAESMMDYQREEEDAMVDDLDDDLLAYFEGKEEEPEESLIDFDEEPTKNEEIPGLDF